MNDWEKFEANHLPMIKAFHGELNLSGISKCDYNHAQRVWRAFGMKNLGDYYYLYLEIDVLLLCNVFETFRTTCLEHYILDPDHFYISPGLAWQVSLKKTGVDFETIFDLNMLLMFE